MPIEGRLAFLILLLVAVLSPACKKEGGKRAPVVCYRNMERGSPGMLVLSGKVDCEASGSMYKLFGTRERPGKVFHIDDCGVKRASYEVRYDEQGRPVFEERIFRVESSKVRVFNRGDKMEFINPVRSMDETVRIRTRIDPAGHPVVVEKYHGADLAYRMKREYEGERLVSETAYDGDGRLKFRTNISAEKGRWIERMVDASGKVLLERELEKAPPE